MVVSVMDKIQTFILFASKITYLNYENNSVEDLKDSILFSILAEKEKEFLYHKINEYKNNYLFNSTIYK